MATKSKRPTDISQLATSIVRESTEENAKADQDKKNPAAVELGRLGGLKGGAARAAKLSAADRKQIAEKAASVRWTSRKKTSHQAS